MVLDPGLTLFEFSEFIMDPFEIKFSEENNFYFLSYFSDFSDFENFDFDKLNIWSKWIRFQFPKFQQKSRNMIIMHNSNSNFLPGV